MPNPYFRFKQFTIHQQHAAMKVGTDGVLLGAWADCNNCGHILDIGTGTGLIALMMAQRSNAIIDAIEIDENAGKDAIRNFTASPWSDRLFFIQNAIQNFAQSTRRKYDLIICNPPFFKKALKTPDASRNLARHDVSLSIEELFLAVSNLLNNDGTMSVIIPALIEHEYIAEAARYNLFPSRLTLVKPTPESEPKRVLISFRHVPSATILTDNLVIEQFGRHGYSDRYKALTGEYYLKL